MLTDSALDIEIYETKPIKIPGNIPRNMQKAYSSSEKPFDPSSPPENEFMKRLKQRMNTYNKSENLSTFTSA